jgi:SAM-dependent methyltransferase
MALTDTDESGWPFWSPSDPASVEVALDLANLRRGERFVDLGCGDGQVLVAAAKRGARVVGIEIDEGLADQARETLAANGLEGKVFVADLLSLDLEADVIFAYLSPATLQRLTPALRVLDEARLVTLDYDVPDLVADKVSRGARLYRLPGRNRAAIEVGWTNAGAIVATVPEVESLTVLEMGHPGGSVDMVVSPALRRAGDFRAGLDVAEPGQPVAIDVRWAPPPAGTVATGTIRISGVEPFALTVCVGFEEKEEPAVWDLSDEGAANLAAALRRRGDRRPKTAAQLVAAAEG